MTSPNRDIPIHSWPGSYYINSEKRWEAGTLSLTRTMLRFTSDQSRENLVSFRLSRIMEIKMESSSLIFSTLTVLEQGNIKHWFGSLRPNRVVVYNVLEHFWRERLLSPSTEVQVAEAQSTKGRELINLVVGTQRRLEDTGNVLHYQGEQFDNMMHGLDKIDSDLGVADKLLSELESPPWWPFSKLLWKSQQDEKAVHAAREAACKETRTGKHRVITSIPAIVSRGRDSDLKPGCLIVMVSSLEVRDTNYALLHHFERDEVDDIRVHNPYEISVRQRFIGKPDICFRLLSAKMPEAMSVLEMQYKKKVEYTSEYSAFKTASATTPGDQDQCSIWNAECLQQYQETEVPMAVPAGELSQVQLHVLKPEVTQAEAQELRQVRNLVSFLTL
uniref:Synaptosomal-associated protein 47 n=1 Tax=Esox lucius TaxID=8010 RepID=A0A3P8Z5P5_ESOLU